MRAFIIAVVVAGALSACGGDDDTAGIRATIETAWPTPWLTAEETAAHIDSFVKACEGDRDALNAARMTYSFSEAGREHVVTILSAACPERLPEVQS